MIKAVIFDLDDTLLWDKKSVKESFVATCQEAQTKYELDPEELEMAVRESARELYASYETYPFTKMIGINPFEGLWGNFDDKINKHFRKMKEMAPIYRKESWMKGLQTLGIDDPQLGYELGELFPAMRRKKPFVYDDTFKVLKPLQDKYTLVLLTNGSPSLQHEKLDMTPELVPYFDHIIVSGAFGRGKPDPSIFKHALFLLSLHPDEAMMIGDNVRTDILGSNRVGMRNVWINREGTEPADDIPSTYEVQNLEELPSLIASLE